MKFEEKYGPWALVAGGSEGIGGAFADQLAASGLNLILVARRPEPLQQKAAELRSRFGVEVRVVAQDLQAEDVLERIQDQTGDLEVGLLVYCAHYTDHGIFGKLPIEDQKRIMDINVRGCMLLTHHFSSKMLERKRGGVIIISSMVGFQGAPYTTHYGATKAYNIALAEGLWYEYQGYNVDVLGLVAGATDTPTYRSQNPKKPDWYAPRVMEPAAVVREGLLYLGRKPTHIAGRGNRIGHFFLSRLLPRAKAIASVGEESRKMFGG